VFGIETCSVRLHDIALDWLSLKQQLNSKQPHSPRKNFRQSENGRQPETSPATSPILYHSETQFEFACGFRGLHALARWNSDGTKIAMMYGRR
jgi:hypothetical protein